MLYSIENKCLKITVDTLGAQLQSIQSKKTEREYLWQGDSAYWTGRAYNLFPTIGRMYKNTYSYQGKKYKLRNHGVARYNVFKCVDRTATKLVFLLTENEDTLQEYPFRFRFYVTFTLKDNQVCVRYDVQNSDDKPLICAVGGHPGINVPFDGGTFEDYYFQFDQTTNVEQRILSENKFMSGAAEPYPLRSGNKIPLRHPLFDNDAIILANTCRCIHLKNTLNKTSVTVRYDDFKYLGLWHMPMTDAPYVCIEPWTALPATEGITDDLQTKADMQHINPNESYAASYSIQINEQ